MSGMLKLETNITAVLMFHPGVCFVFLILEMSGMFKLETNITAVLMFHAGVCFVFLILEICQEC